MSKYVRQEKSQRKHPVASSAASLIRAPVVPTAPKERPGWKGPGFMKRAIKAAQPSGHSKSACVMPLAIQEQYLPTSLQQSLLNVLQTSFPVCQEYETLKPMLQGIRLALAEGDSDTAFSRRDWMEAYALRWSSIRALCCATVLLGICEDFRENLWVRNLRKDERLNVDSSSKAICFGGGPTEVMAFAAAVRHIRQLPSDVQSTNTTQLPKDEPSIVPSSAAPIMGLYLVDKADWAPVVSRLETGLLTPPVLSKYASQSAKLNNASFIRPGHLGTHFLQSDALGAAQEDLVAIIGSTPSLITFFFTLENLSTTSTAKTAALLLKLTLAAPSDSLLLIIDSPDSPSEAAAAVSEANKQKRRFRMGNWLDLVLMDKLVIAGVAGKPAWKALTRDENRLFKMEEGLKFPISLDHVKFQVHLFQKR